MGGEGVVDGENQGDEACGDAACGYAACGDET
jgi:hypothetical protein